MEGMEPRRDPYSKRGFPFLLPLHYRLIWLFLQAPLFSILALPSNSLATQLSPQTPFYWDPYRVTVCVRGRGGVILKERRGGGGGVIIHNM